MAAAASNNRRVTIILVIGGLFIALLAAYNLMGGGGGGPNDSSTIPPPVTSAEGLSGAQTPTTTAPGAPTLPNGQFDVFVTRNPFEPAIQIVSDTSGTDTGGTDTGGTVTPPDTSGGTTPPDTTPASPEPSAGTTVAVIDVFDQDGVLMARVQVGSTVYTVAAGQTFATSYKVVSLSGDCGEFLFGDSPFSLCQGEQVIK